MTRQPRATLVIASVAMALGASRCSPDCVHPPCALPTAIVINVTSASGEPITNASAKVNNISGAIACRFGSLSNMCMVPGSAGTYTVRVTADGFQSATESIIVTGSSPPCGCGAVDTRMVTIVLTPM